MYCSNVECPKYTSSDTSPVAAVSAGVYLDICQLNDDDDDE